LRHRVAVLEKAKDITERKKGEEELLFKSTLLEAQSETSIDGILVVDSEGKSISFNKNFGRMWNIHQQILDTRDDEKMLQHVLYQLKNPEKFLERVKYLYAHKNEKSRDEIQFRDGRVFDRYSSPLLDSNDKYYGRVWYFRDITEHKKMDEELRESEERFRTIFDNAPDGLLVADAESKKINTANKAFCQMLGYNREELKNLRIMDIHPKKALPYVMEQFEKQARGEFTLGRDIPVKRKDGSVFYADINSFPITLAGKSYLMGVFRDITERKQMEEMLRDSQERLQLAVSGTNLGLWDWNVQTGEAVYNRQWAEMLGYSLEEIEPNANSWKRLVHPDDAPQMMEILNLHFEKKTPFYEAEFRMRTKSGGWKCFLSVGRVFEWDDDGKPLRMTGTHRDITERKKAEEELNEYREKTARAEQLASLGTLSATIAHRLTSPLTSVRLSIENSLADLETTSCPDTVTEYLKDGLSGVSEVVSIVDSFRDFAKKSSEKNVSQVVLKAVAERIVKLLNESARRAKVSLHLKGIDKLPSIYSNEKDLEQLFFALVENAIQAADGKKNRQLIIDGTVKDEHIELRFADNCCGIAPENLDRIFEPFFTTRPAGEGTGLGLCVVEHIVSRAGGKIHVASKAGEGSTFFVTLPINKGRRS